VVDLSLYMEGYDTNFSQESNLKSRNLENLLLEAQHQLESRSHSQQELKKIYAGAMDFAGLDKIRLGLIEEIRLGKS